MTTYWANLDENNIVTQVLTTRDNDEEALNKLEELYGGVWLKTDVQTRRGIHYDPETGEPSKDQSLAFRKNYAGIGYSYDPDRDAFIPPQHELYPSWVIDEETCDWVAPVPKPEDTENGAYSWDEENQKWDFVPI